MKEIIKYAHAAAVIRQAMEESRCRGARAGNAETLSLYYGIGKYVSENTRSGAWGTDAVRSISKQLQQELPGLRGYSESNIRNRRQFCEEWQPFVNRQPGTGDLDWKEFLAVGFSHHMEIIAKVKDSDRTHFLCPLCNVIMISL